MATNFFGRHNFAKTICIRRLVADFSATAMRSVCATIVPAIVGLARASKRIANYHHKAFNLPLSAVHFTAISRSANRYSGSAWV